MTRTTLMLAAIIGFAAVPTFAQLPTETEDFDVEPDDWGCIRCRMPEDFVDFGWDDGSGNNQYRSANTIGDSPGWAGGIFPRSRIDPAIYVDVTIGNYTLDDELHATGKFWLDEDEFYNGGTAFGFFDATDIDNDDPNRFLGRGLDMMGMVILEDERQRADYVLDEQGYKNVGISQRGFNKGFATVPIKTPFEFEMHWDPNDPFAFGEGVFTTTIRNMDSGEESVLVLPMTFLGREAGAKFNAFGLVVGGPSDPPHDRIDNIMEFFFDDIEYTSNDSCGVQEFCDRHLTGPPVPVAGDANNDGSVDTADIVQILGAAKFETGMAATFEQGDFDGDGVFATSDIVAMLGEGKFETGPYRALQDPFGPDVQLNYVPEPSTVILFALGLIGVVGCNRRRWA